MRQGGKSKKKYSSFFPQITEILNIDYNRVDCYQGISTPMPFDRAEVLGKGCFLSH